MAGMRIEASLHMNIDPFKTAMKGSVKYVSQAFDSMASVAKVGVNKIAALAGKMSRAFGSAMSKMKSSTNHFAAAALDDFEKAEMGGKESAKKVESAWRVGMRKGEARINGWVAKHREATKKAALAHKNASKSMANTWWRRFGEVAIGFTLAYRAMNVLERGLMELGETFREAITESGELAAAQAKLALWTRIHTQATEPFAETFRKAAGNVRVLANESVYAVSSLGDLATGLDEVAQAVGSVPPNLIPQLIDVVDFTVLIAQTTGSTTRQIRQELQALMSGQVRTTNMLIRALKGVGVITEEDIKNLKNMTNRAETLEKVLKAISKYWREARRDIISADVNLAFAFWEKSLRRSVTYATEVASKFEKVNNIFGEKLYVRAENFLKALSPDQISRTAVMLMGLRDALDWVLESMEATWLGMARLYNIMYNAREKIGVAAKYFGTFLIIPAITLSIKLLGKAMLWLALSPLRSIASAFGLAGTVLVWFGRQAKAAIVSMILMNAVLTKGGVIAAWQALKIAVASATKSLLMVTGSILALLVKLVLIPAAVAAAAIAIETLFEVPEGEEKFQDALRGILSSLAELEADRRRLFAKPVMNDADQKRLEELNEAIEAYQKQIRSITKERHEAKLPFWEAYEKNVKDHIDTAVDLIKKGLEKAKDLGGDLGKEALDGIVSIFERIKNYILQFDFPAIDLSGIQKEMESILESLGFAFKDLKKEFDLEGATNAIIKLEDELWVLNETLWLARQGIATTAEEFEEFGTYLEAVAEGLEFPDQEKGAFYSLTQQVYKARKEVEKLMASLSLADKINDAIAKIDLSDVEQEYREAAIQAKEWLDIAQAIPNLRNREIAIQRVTEWYKKRNEEILADSTYTYNMLEDLSERTAKSIERSFSEFFFETMQGNFEDLEDVAKSALRAIEQVAADVMGQLTREWLFGHQKKEGAPFEGGLLSSIVGGISGMFGGGSTAPGAGGMFAPFVSEAQGDVFNKGLMALAQGGVLSNNVIREPQFFQSGGTFGVLGEAGPEGVLPLARTASGDLGVKTTGGASSEPINVILNIQALDAQSFTQYLGRNKNALVKPIIDLMQTNRPVRTTMREAR